MNNAGVSRIKALIRRDPGSGQSVADEKTRGDYSRMGTKTLENRIHPDTQLGLAEGRMGNDYPYPDNPRGGFILENDPGDRYQSIANSGLSEGPNPGRIPRGWQDRRLGKTGRDLSGTPNGGNFFDLGITGNPDGGVGDAKYIQHVQVPRGSVIARAYARTVDDAANVPAVYVSDPTRR
jgi:hypothetical protein